MWEISAKEMKMSNKQGSSKQSATSRLKGQILKQLEDPRRMMLELLSDPMFAPREEVDVTKSVKSMAVKAWGTRGSIAVSNRQSVFTGGNTTCFEVMSPCFPSTTKVMLDVGTGFVPTGHHYLLEMGNGLQYAIFLTHPHWDHILGMTLAPPTFIDIIPILT